MDNIGGFPQHYDSIRGEISAHSHHVNNHNITAKSEPWDSNINSPRGVPYSHPAPYSHPQYHRRNHNQSTYDHTHGHVHNHTNNDPPINEYHVPHSSEHGLGPVIGRQRPPYPVNTGLEPVNGQLIPLASTTPAHPNSTENPPRRTSNHKPEHDELLVNARVFYQQRLYQKAEGICLSIYHEDAFNEDNLLLLGAIYFQCRLFDLSLFYTKLATKANCNMAEAYGNLANILKEKGDIQGALVYYQKALSLKPFVEGYCNLAVTYGSIGLLNEAERCYKIALQINPDLVFLHCDIGNVYKLAGKLESAKAHYLEAIKRDPEFSIAWNNLGCVYLLEKRTDDGFACFEKAVKFDSNYFDAWVNLAAVYRERKDYERSLRCYQFLQTLQPNNAILFVNIASIYYEQKQWDTAIHYYLKAIELQPDFADAYCNMGNAYKEKADVQSAVHNYYLALNINPNHPDTLNNLANVMKDQRRLNDACSMYIQALSVRPTFAAAHSNLASVYKEMKKYEEAKFHYNTALRLNPEFSDAYSNLGNLLKEMGAVSEALACYNRAVHINPNHADAYSNIASTCKDSNDIASAICYYRKALELKQDFPDAFCNLEHCLQLVCDWNGLDERMEKMKALVNDQLGRGLIPSVQPHHTMLYPFEDLAYLNIAKAHGALASANASAFNMRPFSFYHLLNGHYPERIRVGYVSSDFGNHPTSHLMQSVPGFHDKDRIEVFCYALSVNDGSVYRQKIENEAEHFVDLTVIQSHVDAARRIYEDGIHVLINLNGYTKGSRNEIFALKPAPIQIMWLGYPGTSGASYMDYIVTDKMTSPKEYDHMYSETFIYMPDTFFVGDHKQMFHFMTKSDTELDELIDEVFYAKKPEAYGIPPMDVEPIEAPVNPAMRAIPIDIEVKVANNEVVRKKRITEAPVQREGSLSNANSDGKPDTTYATKEEAVVHCAPEPPSLVAGRPVVYCNFNQLYKIDPEIFDVWLNILERVPNSIIWLLLFPALGEVNLRKEMEKRGIQSNRIVFSALAGKEEHIYRGRYADMFLDTPVCNGHTTGMDILWAGTPMLTLPKKTFPSRVASSLLTALGCPELITESYKEYEDFAVKFGNEPSFREKVKAKVKRQRLESPLFDTRKLTHNLERGYEHAWKVYKSNALRGLPPNSPKQSPLVLT
eukprot:Nk52_evm4s301 gene=Nk52_evmTU4s301